MRLSLIRTPALLAVLGALAAAPALAAEPPAGRLLASHCAQCHGTNGNAVNFESLAGESANELYHELIEMKYRSRIEGIMDLQARGYTDAQLWLISQYYAAQPRTGSSHD
jgi:sulfide dehydrogenase cytochrome subunit